jgi:tetratricopeptide (TPR) repeat protein
MNKQELLKQADYTFQRGNRELAKKYLTEYIHAYPNDEAAWILLARVVEDKIKKIECFERALKINPNNNEIKIAIARLRTRQNTLSNQKQVEKFYLSTIRGVLMVLVVFLLLGTTSFVIARNNPQSFVRKILFPATEVPAGQAISEDLAPQTRAEVNAIYPEYSALVDALLGLAVQSADAGLEGAPERPGDAIVFSSQASAEAKDLIMNALPQADSLSSITITEQQVTSWLATEMGNSPDLPLRDVQVYLRNGQVQVWGMITGSVDSTSALVVGEIKIDANQKPYFEIVSMQIGTQVVPDVLLGQMEVWLNQMLVENINEQLPGLQMMNVNVVNGLITVSGMR